jgi:hypothetical protein
MIADGTISVQDVMRPALIITLAALGLLVWDRQVNNSLYTDTAIKMATEIKRSFLGR